MTQQVDDPRPEEAASLLARAARVVLAVAVMSSAAVSLSACLGFESGSCGEASPRSVANENIRFLGLVQQGDIPDSVAGDRIDDPYGCAYPMLCEELRSVVSEEEFRATGGEAVSTVLAADTFQGPSVYQPDLDLYETRSSDSSATIDFVAGYFERIDEVTVVADSETTERWQTALVREDGNWKVCGFSQLSD